MPENITIKNQYDTENTTKYINKLTSDKIYTENQLQIAYNEGQRAGYISAIKQIRSNINDYLDHLLVTTGTNKGE